VTDSTGALKARYDYDPYGKAVVVDGNMNVDFGYTGHYFHAPSGLNLALYRAYNPALGRWLSRDPIAEAGGINLYGYVANNPLNTTDPLGLEPPSSPRCQLLKRSIEEKERILEGKYRELANDRGNLPQSAPGDEVNLGLSIDGHLQQIAYLEAKLAADIALYAATCNDPEPPNACRFRIPSIPPLTQQQKNNIIIVGGTVIIVIFLAPVLVF
jgi:RHS repeat-associated protein